MATKVWTGATDGDYSDKNNWMPLSIVNSKYQWTESGSGTSEYYLELSGGGNPGVEASLSDVLEDGSAMTSGTAGTLTAGQWDWADNDTLGFSTIYVRLADSTDPDTKPKGWVEYQDIPRVADNVLIPNTSAVAITTGLAQSGVAIVDFRVEKGYTGTIGAAGDFLQIDPDRFEFGGTGKSYIDLGSAATDVRVTQTAPNGSVTSPNLFLQGTAIADLSVRSGNVALGYGSNEVGAVTSVATIFGGTLTLGDEATATTIYSYGGETLIRDASVVTVNAYGGTVRAEGTQTITTFRAYGGTHYINTSGDVVTCHLLGTGATVSTLESSIEREITNLKVNRGTFIYDKNVITITNHVAPDDPVKITATSPV